MKYNVSHLPNSSHSLNFRVRNPKGKEETVFQISKEAVSVWGNPSEAKLKELMVAHIKKNGWAKETVMICGEKSPRNLTVFIDSMLHGKSKK